GTVRAILRARERPPGRRSRDPLHAQRAQRRRVDGLLPRRLPARHAGRRRDGQGDRQPDPSAPPRLRRDQGGPRRRTRRHDAVDVAGTPVYVTENGIGTADDDQRVQYVTEALHRVGRCLDDGLDVRGYFYWSLLDNFEWSLGYRPTFGLVAVDRETHTRTVKPSARWLGEIARSNRFDS